MPAREAVITAWRVRLRPILMTTLATIVGLLPMALRVGERSESYSPLARALVGGLSVSGLCTLFVAPAGFYLAHRAYDDSDGWYNHVMPPIVSPSATPADALTGTGSCGVPKAGEYAGRCGYGPRLPLLLISP